MTDFLGEYRYSLDLKGRVPIPPRYRADFRDGLVLSQSVDKCIDMYTVAEWAKTSARLTSLSSTQLNARRLKRRTSSRTYNAKVDGQGRVMVPPLLREYLGFKNEVTVVGAADHLEIWERAAWEAEQKFMDDNIVDISENVKMPE